jgi:hypothetical protein
MSKESLIEAFIETHKSQLRKSKLPELYWATLFYKLEQEVLDAGSYFQICMRVDEDDQVIGYKAICSNENGLSKDDPIGYFYSPINFFYQKLKLSYT